MGPDKWLIPLIGSGVLAGVISVSSSAGALVQRLDGVGDDVASIARRIDGIEADTVAIKREIAEQKAQEKVADMRLDTLEKNQK